MDGFEEVEFPDGALTKFLELNYEDTPSFSKDLNLIMSACSSKMEPPTFAAGRNADMDCFAEYGNLDEAMSVLLEVNGSEISTDSNFTTVRTCPTNTKPPSYAVEPPNFDTSMLISAGMADKNSSMAASFVTVDYPSSMTAMSFEESEYEIFSQSESLDDIIIPVNFRNAATLNEAYQEKIRFTVEALEAELENNLAKQKKIVVEINQRMQKASKVRTRKNSLGFFSYPYFKDVRGFSHLPNTDTKMKRNGDELDNYVTRPKEWGATEKKKLIQKVAAESRNNLLLAAQTELQLLTRAASRPGLSEKQKAEQTAKMGMIGRDVKVIQRMPDEELLGEREDDHDWMSIAQSFPSHIGPRSCQLTWRHVVHPSNGSDRPWTTKEDAALKKLVAAGDFVQWEDVANMLNTGRSGYQCFVRYQREEVKDSSIRKLWTDDDDEKLFQLVEAFRIEEFVPWAKVAYCLPGRTKEQCCQRYNFSLRSNLKKGTFLEEEDFLILAGVELFGKAAWSHIADFVPQRTANQLSSRYHGFLNADFRDWTPDENRRLLALVQQLGLGRWAVVARGLNEGGTSQAQRVMRSRTQVKNQFLAIYSIFEKYRDNFNLEEMKSSSLQQVRLGKRKTAFDDALEEFVRERREMVSEDQEEDHLGDGNYTTGKGVAIGKQELKEFFDSLRGNINKVYKEAAENGNPPCKKLSVKASMKEGKPKKKNGVAKVKKVPKSKAKKKAAMIKC